MRSDFIAGQMIRVFVWQRHHPCLLHIAYKRYAGYDVESTCSTEPCEKFEYFPYRSWEASEDGVIDALAGIGLGCHG